MSWRPTVAVLLLVLGVAGCSTQGLAFRQDQRVTFVAPDDRELVALPVTVDWEVEDFTVLGPGETAQGDSGSFAVFVDRIPQPPGEPIGWFAEEDEVCQDDPGCPDDEYFTSRGIHTTTDTEFTIDVLPRSPEGRRDMHEVTVVLLDPDGRRIGETAWRIEFEVDRTGSRG